MDILLVCRNARKDLVTKPDGKGEGGARYRLHENIKIKFTQDNVQGC